MFVKVARSKHGVLDIFLSCASDHTIFRDICVQGGLLMNMRGDLMNASRAFGDVLINFRGNFSYQHPQKKQLKQHQQEIGISSSVATATIAKKGMRLSPVPLAQQYEVARAPKQVLSEKTLVIPQVYHRAR